MLKFARIMYHLKHATLKSTIICVSIVIARCLQFYNRCTMQFKGERPKRNKHPFREKEMTNSEFIRNGCHCSVLGIGPFLESRGNNVATGRDSRRLRLRRAVASWNLNKVHRPVRREKRGTRRGPPVLSASSFYNNGVPFSTTRSLAATRVSPVLSPYPAPPVGSRRNERQEVVDRLQGKRRQSCEVRGSQIDGSFRSE